MKGCHERTRGDRCFSHRMCRLAPILGFSTGLVGLQVVTWSSHRHRYSLDEIVAHALVVPRLFGGLDIAECIDCEN